MNDIDDLKYHVAAHAESVGIPAAEYRAVLDGIRTDGFGPGSWVFEWSSAAEEHEADGDLVGASHRYGFARFPFVDGNARQDALENSVRTIGEWAAATPGVTRVDLPLLDGTVGLWTLGLDAAPARPLLVISGGIVSTKEQWAPVLLAGAQLGYATVVTELPGVGENTLRYTAESWRLFPELLDSLAGHADVDRTVAMALSFSGHLALRAAAEEPRLRGIVTAAAPVHGVFADAAWQAGLPKTTVDTLAHLTDEPADRLRVALAGWALTPAQLGAITVPVHYVASSRDEVIAPGDLELLRAHVGELHVLEHDDVHGAPAHAAQTRAWMVAALRSHAEQLTGAGSAH